MDINKHRFYLVQLLKDIYSDLDLASCLGFKGGTALMFFYDLPRFSVDLDFNLINVDKQTLVYEKLRRILLKYGSIHDEAQKYYGLILVLDYGHTERKLKIEISNRIFEDRYEVKNLLGIPVKVMVAADMFAHKLCALLDRDAVANRDVFDCWFFMNHHFPVNKSIIENRMKMSYADYLKRCIDELEKRKEKNMLQGLGELMNQDMKQFVRTKLYAETVSHLKFYKDYPILG
ncbi:MAG: hypothetical protein CVT96_03995 [Bacteroidetes bacterium HGW-Bacteroidetes-13]|nr:MAG: hypothetical protein CVT96_03995 [Bacteroidetes bacterium HGW-Bacteroidetes-13]